MPRARTQKSTADPSPDSDPPAISVFALFRYATRREQVAQTLGVFLALLVGGIQPAFMLVFAQAIDDFAAPSGPGLSSDLLPVIGVVAVASGAIALAQAALVKYVSASMCTRLRVRYVRALLSQDLAWYDSQGGTGKLVSRAATDIDVVQDGVTSVGLIVTMATTGVGGLVVGFVLQWQLALLLLAAAPVLMAIGCFFGKFLARTAREGQSAYGDADALATEALSAIRVVFAFGGEAREATDYAAAVEKGAQLVRQGTARFSVGLGVSMTIIFVVQAGALYYGTTLIAGGASDSPGNVFVAFMSVITACFGLGNASVPVRAVTTACGVAAHVYETVERTPTIPAVGSETGAVEPLDGTVTFDQVHFTYPSRPSVPVLRGISFTVGRGKALALIGESGCGKSTVASLLQRLYDVPDGDAGEVRVGGMPIKDVPIDRLRLSVSTVRQEPALFARSIRANIALGAPPGTSPTDDEIEEVARNALAHDFIAALPDGYDTVLGEGSATQVSGGQKQRIAIARALLRRPSILILDEATSALDSASERIVQDAINRIRTLGITTVTIAHRLSTIVDSDEILVFAAGQIVERGSHSSLLSADGEYARLYRKQKTAELAVSGTPATEAPPSHGNRQPRVRRKKRRAVSRGRQRARSPAPPASSDVEAGQVTSSNDPCSGVGDDDLSTLGAMLRVARWVPPAWRSSLVLGLVATTGEFVMMVLNTMFVVYLLYDMFALLDPATADGAQDQVVVHVLALGAVGISRGVLMGIRTSLIGRAASALHASVRARMFDATLRKPQAFFDERENGIGSLVARFGSSAGIIDRSLAGALSNLYGVVVLVLTTIIILLSFSPVLTGALSFLFPLLSYALYLQRSAKRGDAHVVSKACERGGALASEAVMFIDTVHSLGQSLAFGDEYEAELDVARRKLVRSARREALAAGFTQVVHFGAVGGGFAIGSVFVENGWVTTDAMFMVVFVLIFASQGVGGSLANAADVDQFVEATKTVTAAIDMTSPIDARSPAGLDVVVTDAQRGRAALNNVSFTYPSRPAAPVLDGLDASTVRGRTLALVGASGSGKSTVIALLMRLYDPSSGNVSVGSIDARDWRVSSLRRQLALVPQEPQLFNRTVRANIAYGREDASDAEIEAAATLSHAHDFIMSLPDGYDTVVGEGGRHLSGGQRQRIAIARAVVCRPAILLLDEATSALDNQSQGAVQEALDDAKDGTTTVCIAHRLSTIQGAASIAVVSQGRIVEQGTHAQLLRQRGEYYRLVQHQLLVEGVHQ